MVGMLIPLITVTLQFTNIYCTLSLPTLKYSAPWSYILIYTNTKGPRMHPLTLKIHLSLDLIQALKQNDGSFNKDKQYKCVNTYNGHKSLVTFSLKAMSKTRRFYDEKF